MEIIELSEGTGQSDWSNVKVHGSIEVWGGRGGNKGWSALGGSCMAGLGTSGQIVYQDSRSEFHVD